MLVQVRRKGKIFKVDKQGNDRKVRNLFFLRKIISTAIFIPYWLGTQVEIEERDTFIDEDIILCKFLAAKGKSYWAAVL